MQDLSSIFTKDPVASQLRSNNSSESATLCNEDHHVDMNALKSCQIQGGSLFSIVDLWKVFLDHLFSR
jgi:hypothetical protein